MILNEILTSVLIKKKDLTSSDNSKCYLNFHILFLFTQLSKFSSNAKIQVTCKKFTEDPNFSDAF